MKTRFFTSRFCLGSTFAAGLALALLSAPASFSQEAANIVADTASNTVAQTVTSGQNSNPTNVLGLPPETLNRLSPQQIMTLMQERLPGRPQGSNFMHSVGDVLVPILVPFGVFATVIAIVAIGISQKLKRNKMLHETLRMMIEKGQPIPPELLQPQEPARRPRSDLRRGLVFIAIGIGVVIMGVFTNRVVSAAGSIPLLMGVAFLIVWKIESKKNGGQLK